MSTRPPSRGTKIVIWVVIISMVVTLSVFSILTILDG
jgi:hypothetical protein